MVIGKIRNIKEMSDEWWLNIKAQYPEYDYDLYHEAVIIGMCVALDEQFADQF